MNDAHNPVNALQGDPSELPNRGTATGVLAGTHGADLSLDATGALGRVADAGSDAAFVCCVPSQQMSSGTNAPGDAFNGRIGGRDVETA